MNAAELLMALPQRILERGRGARMTHPCALGTQSCTSDTERQDFTRVAQAYVDEVSRLPFTWTCPHGATQVHVEPTPIPPGADVMRGGVTL